MTTMNPLIFVLVTAVLGQIRHGNGNNLVSTRDVTLPDQELTANPDGILCPYILSLDCHDQRSEMCSSDGITYTNDCHFLQKSCVAMDLEVAHLGVCGTNTNEDDRAVIPSAPSPTGTMTKSTTLQALMSGTSTVRPLTGGLDMNNLSTIDSTRNDTTTGIMTTMMLSTTQSTVTTTQSIAQIIKSVFCDHKDEITCDQLLDFQCGSNGRVYPNKCEFYKAVCDNATLILADPSRCAT